MTISIGDSLPAATLREMTADGPKEIPIDSLVRGRRVVLFGLPGAFTPTCSARHVPGYLALADKFKEHRVDVIACVAVNDAYVMGAWEKDQRTAGKIRMLADGSADLTRAIGLEQDLSGNGMGLRSKRFSMLVDDGVVRMLNVEEPGKFEVSDAETMLYQLGKLQ